jgi:hypothetical protein
VQVRVRGEGVVCVCVCVCAGGGGSAVEIPQATNALPIAAEEPPPAVIEARGCDLRVINHHLKCRRGDLWRNPSPPFRQPAPISTVTSTPPRRSISRALPRAAITSMPRTRVRSRACVHRRPPPTDRGGHAVPRTAARASHRPSRTRTPACATRGGARHAACCMRRTRRALCASQSAAAPGLRLSGERGESTATAPSVCRPAQAARTPRT